MEILNIVLPIFLIIGLGFALRHFKVLQPDWVHVLNGFAYYVSLPAIILVSFWQIDWRSAQVLTLVGTNVLAIVVFSALLLIALSYAKISAKLKAALFMTALTGNTVYMGFPLVGGAFSAQYFSGIVGAATGHLVLGIVFSVLAAEFFVVKSKNISKYFKDFFTNPLMMALILGIILSLLNIKVSDANIIQKTLTMLAVTASPVALFALGAFMHGKFLKHHASLAGIAVILKLIAFPIIILVVFKLLNLAVIPNNTISALVASMPTAVTAFVIAEKYKLDESYVTNVILLGTAASLVTISVWLLMLT
jgi:predicted permease